MGLNIGLQLQVSSDDGTMLVNINRVSSVINPVPRDTANNADLGMAAINKMVKEVEDEATEQLEAWKAAVMNLLGGGS